TRYLRADKSRTAPADEVAVGVTQRPACPVTTRAANRIGRTVALIYDVTRRRRVGRIGPGAVRDRAADDGATDDAGSNARTDCATIATGVSRGWYAQSANCQSGCCRKRKDRLLHRVFPPEVHDGEV